jgi:aerobic-type carbon monoxide dehydrogenase small subunit (CoxS/CutS family)
VHHVTITVNGTPRVAAVAGRTHLADLLRDTLGLTEEEIAEALGGNICRCTGYQQIREAVVLAARLLADARGAGTGRPRGADRA